MRSDRDKISTVPANGLLAGLVEVTKSGLGLLLSRLELAALELSELRDHLLKLAVIFSLAMIAIFFAVGYATLLIVYLVWNNLDWKILLIMTFFFAAMAGFLLIYARSLLSPNKLCLSATMVEIKADREMLL